MIAPAPLLLILIATMSAGLAHSMWGKRWLQLLISWLAAFTGCLIAFIAGLHMPFIPKLIEPAGVPVVEAVLLAWVLMYAASRIRV